MTSFLTNLLVAKMIERSDRFRCKSHTALTFSKRCKDHEKPSLMHKVNLITAGLQFDMQIFHSFTNLKISCTSQSSA